MALVLNEAARNALLDAIDTVINTGAGTAVMEMQLSNGTEVATLPLNNPAFGAAAAGVMALDTVSADVKDTSATGNVSNVSKFVIKDRDGNVVITGTLASDGTGDINLNSTLIAAGAVVQIDSFSLTAPNAS